MSAGEHGADVLRRELAKIRGPRGSFGPWANLNGFSTQFINAVMRGDKDPTERLANALGFIRQVQYIRFSPEASNATR